MQIKIYIYSNDKTKQINYDTKRKHIIWASEKRHETELGVCVCQLACLLKDHHSHFLARFVLITNKILVTVIIDLTSYAFVSFES